MSNRVFRSLPVSRQSRLRFRPPAAAGTQPVRTASAFAYWPVYLVTGLASFLVVAGVTLAVQRMRHAPEVPVQEEVATTVDGKAVAVIELGPAPKLEAEIPAGSTKPASPSAASSTVVLAGSAKPLELAPPASPGPEPVIALDEPASEVIPETAEKCDTCGTAIRFMRSPQSAARRAGAEDKLVFLLHVSGNFEDTKFTWNNAETLRARALTNDEVGKYVNEFFVSSFQKVSSFVIANQQKQGGNVASYFCLPDGRVLHAIAGPVDAETFLREARWVVETWKLAQLEGQEDRLRFQTVIRKAHADRLRQEYRVNRLPAPMYAAVVPKVMSLPAIAPNVRQRLGNQGKVHVLLATYPMPRIEQIYVLVFERILNQRLTTIPVVQKG